MTSAPADPRHARPQRTSLSRPMLLLVLASLLPQRAPDLELEWSRPGPAGSALPSWIRGSAPTLVLTSWEEDGPATLGLAAPESPERVEGVLAHGEGWLLNWADFSAAARAGSGTLAWSWLVRSGPADYGTRFQVGAPGSARAPRPLEEHQGPGEHGFVSLAPLSAAPDETRFLALWLDGRDSGAPGHPTRLLARVIGPDADPSPEVTVDPSTCSCCPTDLVLLADGGHLAAWRDRTSDEVRDVSVARFDGRAWSAPRALHADGWQIDGCPVNGPRLAAGEHGVAASWFTGASGGHVLLARGDRKGAEFAAPVDVDDGAPEGRGDLAFLEDGSVVVGWLEHGRERSTWRVRRVRADGTAGPSLVVAEVPGGRSSGFLRLAAGAGGVWAATTETSPARRVVVHRIRPLP